MPGGVLPDSTSSFAGEGRHECRRADEIKGAGGCLLPDGFSADHGGSDRGAGVPGACCGRGSLAGFRLFGFCARTSSWRSPGNHQIKRSPPDPSDEGIDNTFVSLRLSLSARASREPLRTRDAQPATSPPGGKLPCHRRQPPPFRAPRQRHQSAPQRRHSPHAQPPRFPCVPGLPAGR